MLQVKDATLWVVAGEVSWGFLRNNFKSGLQSVPTWNPCPVDVSLLVLWCFVSWAMSFIPTWCRWKSLTSSTGRLTCFFLPHWQPSSADVYVLLSFCQLTTSTYFNCSTGNFQLLTTDTHIPLNWQPSPSQLTTSPQLTTFLLTKSVTKGLYGKWCLWDASCNLNSCKQTC